VRKVLFPALVFLVLPPLAFLSGCSAPPVVDVSPSITVLGLATPVTVAVRDPHGVRKVQAFVEQNGRYSVLQVTQPSKTAERILNFTAGVKSTPQLRDGKAKLIIDATSNALFGKTAHWERDINIATQPPSITADSDQHYLYLGMADLATLNISGAWTEAGIRVGDETFRAWPMPNGKPGYFSLFAFAWNMPPDTAPVAYASNGPGNAVTSPLVYQFPKKEQPKYSVRDLQITDAFMHKVVDELDPHGSGDYVTRFVKINNDMRKANNQTLFDLRTKTADHFLWSQPFQRQSRAQAEAHFADTRNYIYNGRKIDQQTHLGYDLAVTQHVGVEAANDGRIVYAAPLGIYGNCIVVDHGYGLMTLYGHLSQINVHDGDMVKRGQVMGISGMTGMAGGDHIHFGMLLDGIQIDPKEWWDPHWIKDHIAKRVNLPGFQG
jgi:murein DD-endopeptidase MepM/ murein hydrolase activator NlpD